MVKFDMSNQEDMQEAMSLIGKAVAEGVTLDIVKKSNYRTVTQNAALHLMFEQLAQELNDRGLDQRKVLKETVDIPWSKDSIKDFLWRPIQDALFDTTSTTDLKTKEIDEVFKLLQRHLNEKFNVGIEFPSIETLINNQRFN